MVARFNQGPSEAARVRIRGRTPKARLPDEATRAVLWWAVALTDLGALPRGPIIASVLGRNKRVACVYGRHTARVRSNRRSADAGAPAILTAPDRCGAASASAARSSTPPAPPEFWSPLSGHIDLPQLTSSLLPVIRVRSRRERHVAARRHRAGSLRSVPARAVHPMTTVRGSRVRTPYSTIDLRRTPFLHWEPRARVCHEENGKILLTPVTFQRYLQMTPSPLAHCRFQCSLSLAQSVDSRSLSYWWSSRSSRF